MGREDDPRLGPGAEVTHWRGRSTVHAEDEAVVDGLARRESETHHGLAALGVGIAEGVLGMELDAVGVVPEEPLLSLVEGQHDLDTARTEKDGHVIEDSLGLRMAHLLSLRVLLDDLSRHEAGPNDVGGRRYLPVRATPESLDLPLQFAVELPAAAHEGSSEHRPGHGGREKDEEYGGESGHGHVESPS